MSKTMPAGTAKRTHNGRGPKRTVFISAPANADTRPLREALEVMGVTPINIFDMGVPGKSLGESLVNCIRRADLIIGVLESGPANPNVVFELGVASGAGKRILIIADQDAISPTDLVGNPHIRSKLDNEEAIRFAVTQLLSAPHPGKDTGEVAKETHPIGDLADELLADLRAGGTSMREAQLLEIVRRAIEASGVTAAATRRTKDDGIDIAVWSEDLEPWVQNPLIVEITSSISATKSLKQIIEQVGRYMERAHVSTALVVYGESALADQLTDPNVLFISVYDLLESLRSTSFSEIVRKLRNRNVHRKS